jgi:26S proteasome regulatory subunit N13
VDELTHLQWKDRTTNTVVEDVIVMPSDATFTKVDTGRPKDRVYLLQYQGGSARRFFFWMQAASDEKDEEDAKKLNDCMANPPADDAMAGAGAGGAGAAAGGLAGLGGAGAGVGAAQPNVQDLLTSMLGGGSAATPARAPQAPAQVPGAPARAGPGQGQLTQADLQRAMMNLAGMAAQHQHHQQQQQQAGVPLTEVVNADEVLRSGILLDPAVQEQLVPLLAEGQQTPEQLEAIMRSPQLRSTLASLTGALQTDNFNSIMSNFGLDASRGMEALAAGNNVEAFLQALLALQQEEQEQQPAAGGNGGGGGDGGEGKEEKEEGKDEGKE